MCRFLASSRPCHILFWLTTAILTTNACGGSEDNTPANPTAPSASRARIEGNYTLGIDASTRCGFPFNEYRWSVVAQVTSVIAGIVSSEVRLANGSNLLDMLIEITESQGALSSITTRGQFGIPVENNAAYNFASSILGGKSTVVTNSAGRAEVLNTPLSSAGSLSLIRNNPYTVFTCPGGGSFGSWSLRVR